MFLIIAGQAVVEDDALCGRGYGTGKDEVIIIRGHFCSGPIVICVTDPVIDVDVVPVDRICDGDVIRACSSLGELCIVGDIAGNSGELGRPAGEGVGVLSGGRLGRSLAVIGRGRAVGDVFISFESCIAVFPCDGIGVDCFGEVCGVGFIPLRGDNS